MGWGGGLSPNTLITLEHMVMVRGGSSERLNMYYSLIMCSSLLNNIIILEILLKQKQQKQKVIIA